MAAERYVPRGYIGSEQALVLIAKANHPDRWRDELLLGKEREIYDGLGLSWNGEFLGDHIKVNLTKADRESGLVMECVCDFEDAAHWLRENLHVGDLIGKYLDENGDWHDIPSKRWGADDGLEALLKGVVVFDEGRYFVSRLILFSTEELTALIDAGANPYNSRAARPTVSNARAQQEFLAWRAKRGENIPTEEEDIAYMRETFGVSRDRTRQLRKGVRNLPRGKPRKKGE
jgi:hypothetical protein